jgi:hypothetical protein
MTYTDRIVFSSTQTALMLKLQDAGCIGVTENRFEMLPGVAGWSYIGEPYLDGQAYALVTFDGSIDQAVMDARLGDNIDPSRVPLRISSGTIISDPDAAARAAYAQDKFKALEAEFAAYKARDGAPSFKAASVKIAAEKLGELTNIESSIMVEVEKEADKSLWVWWVETPQISRGDAQWVQIEAAMPKLDATALFMLSKEIEG